MFVKTHVLVNFSPSNSCTWPTVHSGTKHVLFSQKNEKKFPAPTMQHAKPEIDGPAWKNVKSLKNMEICPFKRTFSSVNLRQLKLVT